MNTRVRALIILAVFTNLATLSCGVGQPLGRKFPAGDFQCAIPVALQGASDIVMLNFSITPEQKIGDWSIFDAGTRTVSLGAGFGESSLSGDSIQFTLEDVSSGAHVSYKINGALVALNKMSGDYNFDYGDRYGVATGKFDCDLASPNEKTPQNAAPTRPIPTSTLSPEPPSTPTPTCALQCSIDTESYGFDFTCESGPVSKEMNNTTQLKYDSGQVSQVTVQVDQKQTYSSSGNTYNIAGTIMVDVTAGNVSYDIQATGGEFGDTPQTCKAGAASQASPASTLPPEAPSTSTPAAIFTQPIPTPTKLIPTFTQPMPTPTQLIPTFTQPAPAATTGGTSLQSGIPVVQSVVLRKDRSSGDLVIHQDIHFTDSDGDVTRADYGIVSTTNPDVRVEGGTIDIPSALQKAGAFLTGSWGCGGGNYTITLSVTLTDRAGHQSEPYNYTMVCD